MHRKCCNKVWLSVPFQFRDIVYTFCNYWQRLRLKFSYWFLAPSVKTYTTENSFCLPFLKIQEKPLSLRFELYLALCPLQLLSVSRVLWGSSQESNYLGNDSSNYCYVTRDSNGSDNVWKKKKLKDMIHWTRKNNCLCGITACFKRSLTSSSEKKKTWNFEMEGFENNSHGI